MAKDIVPPKGVKDLTGQRFGRLEVKSFEKITISGPKWICKCDCGTSRAVLGCSLKKGRTKSCGCLNAELAKARGFKHGLCETKSYAAWRGMKDRCSNPLNPGWENYGGRGIKVCERWANSFEDFYDDMGEPPSPNHSIDRINVNGHYEPKNCRWATVSEQSVNKRNNRILKKDGKAQCMSQWAEDLGISKYTIWNRITKLGWDEEKALTTPVRKKRD